MGIIKWTFGLFCLFIFFWGVVIAINTIKEKQEYKRTHFKCTYIKGMCNVKVTDENCSGGLPETYCEMKLNGRL
jgi:hypothetical protein